MIIFISLFRYALVLLKKTEGLISLIHPDKNANQLPVGDNSRWSKPIKYIMYRFIALSRKGFQMIIL